MKWQGELIQAWFYSYCSFDGLGEFFLIVELHMGGSASNGDTQNCNDQSQNCSNFKTKPATIKPFGSYNIFSLCNITYFMRFCNLLSYGHFGTLKKVDEKKKSMNYLINPNAF